MTKISLILQGGLDKGGLRQRGALTEGFTVFMMFLKVTSNKFRRAYIIYLCIVSKIDRQKIFWILIYLFLPFIWVNLLSDIINFYDHTFYSLTSLTAFSIAIIFLMIRYPEVFTLSLMKNTDSNASPIIILISILKSIWHAFLFFFIETNH